MTSCFRAFKDLLFPPLCLGCERLLASSRLPLFCPDCLAALSFIQSPCCPCCGVPFPAGVDHLCGDCLARHYIFDFARSLLHYQPPLSTIIRSLKFGGRLTSISTLGALTALSDIKGLFSQPDFILPVPLHLNRLRERGFNQALVIARGCFPEWKNRIETGLLLRCRSTIPQTLLAGKERRGNLKKAFGLASTAKVEGKRVLLVDDVFTTGSTVNECSRALRYAGAARIEIFTLARSLSG